MGNVQRVFRLCQQSSVVDTLKDVIRINIATRRSARSAYALAFEVSSRKLTILRVPARIILGSSTRQASIFHHVTPAGYALSGRQSISENNRIFSVIGILQDAFPPTTMVDDGSILSLSRGLKSVVS